MSRAWLLAGVVVYAVLVISTALTRLPINDEGWYGQPAFRLAAGQSMGTPVLENAGMRRFQGLHEHTYWIMPLFIVAQAGVYKILGTGLLQMRALSAICGLILILSWYSILKTLLDDRWIPALTAIIVAIDFQILSVCATGRSDAMCAASGSAGLAVYLAMRKRRLALGIFLSQSLIVSSGLTHPYGFYYFIALLYLTIHFDRPSLKWLDLAVAIPAYVIGAALWGTYILKAPGDFVAQFGNNASDRSWVLRHPLAALGAELTRYRDAYGLSANAATSRHLEGLILLAYLTGVAGLLFNRSLRRDPAIRPLLVLAGLFLFDLTYFEGAKQPWYLIHILPCLAGLFSIYAVHLLKMPAARGLAIVALSTFAVLNLGVTVGSTYHNGYQIHYAHVVDFLRRSAPEGPIMGGAELGFGLGFDRINDDYKLGYFSGARPDWIVTNESYRAQFELYRLRRPEIWRHVQHRLSNEYVKTFDDGYYAAYSLPSLTRLPNTKAQKELSLAVKK